MKNFLHGGTAFALSVVCALTASAQARTMATFVTMIGTDTVSIEQYGRIGNTIRGVWANRSNSTKAQLYYYEIDLDAHGGVAKYAVLLRNAGSTAPAADLPSLAIDYGRDTAVFSMRGNASMTKRVAMRGAYPRLGTSVVGIELAIDRVRAAGVDASAIVMNSPLGPSFDPIKLPVLFVRPDSVRITKDLTARLDTAGRLIELHDGNRLTRRVEWIDLAAIAEQWASPMGDEKPGITMSLSELQRFVGRYTLSPGVKISIERVGSGLVLDSPNGSLELIAETASSFKVKGETGLVEFETNAAGDVTALTLVNGATRRRATRSNPGALN
jgi:hypothetical protein